MARIILGLLALCSVQLLASCTLRTLEGCEKSCVSMDSQVSSIPCERGCRLYGILNSFNSSSDPLSRCSQDCEEAYKNGSSSTAVVQCKDGCSNYKLSEDNEKAEKEATELSWGGMQPMMQLREVVTRTVDGIRMIQTRVIAIFRKDDQIIEIRTPTQTFVDLRGVEGFQPEEPKLPEIGLRDSRVRDEAAQHPTAQGMDSDMTGESGVRVVALGAKQQQLRGRIVMLVVLQCAIVLLLVYAGLVMYWRRAAHAAKQNKQVNISTAVRQEPLKLVRPEDLTKLSLMDELEGKEDFTLPSAKV